eukprot:s4463_g2.t1
MQKHLEDLATWIRFHVAWYGCQAGDPFDGAFPLNQDKILRVSALFKASGYKSYKNYMSRAKDQHLALGFDWNDHLTRVAQKCARSVLRGLSGRTRSEAFDFLKVVAALSGPFVLRHEGAPTHPLPMIVTATYFMLRELEVSAIELTDITFSSDSVSLHLPVSKTDWAAKGCTRTWSCLCDRELPCPFHVLLNYVNRIKADKEVDMTRPLFVSNSGSHCTKEGVIATIRWAAQMAGQDIVTMEGEHLISGHTFRITGARYLSSLGLDAITVQLLGRWGSDAVLTYLAEAPLQGLASRVKPLAQSGLKQQMQASGTWQENQLDKKTNARDALDREKARRKELADMKEKMHEMERKCEKLSDIVDGIAIAELKSRGVTIEDKQKVWHCTDGRRGAVPSWAQITGEVPHVMPDVRPVTAMPRPGIIPQAPIGRQPARPSIEDELVSLAVAAARHPDTATRALQALRQVFAGGAAIAPMAQPVPALPALPAARMPKAPSSRPEGLPDFNQAMQAIRRIKDGQVVSNEEIEWLVATRERFRMTKDYGNSDELRKALLSVGIELLEKEKRWTFEDGRSGNIPLWSNIAL